jgi:hypothetical protein
VDPASRCSTVVQAGLSAEAGAEAVMLAPSATQPCSKKNQDLRAVRRGLVDPNRFPAQRKGPGPSRHSEQARTCHTNPRSSHSSHWVDSLACAGAHCPLATGCAW